MTSRQEPMQASRLFFPTLREQPADVETAGHALLLRGAFIRRLSAGMNALLPMGCRVLRKIEAVAREEMAAIGAQEIVLPTAHDREPSLLAREIRSYRELPLVVYRIATKCETEPKPKGGLLKAKEFRMLECFSLDESEEARERSLLRAREAYVRITARLGLGCDIVESEAVGEKLVVVSDGGDVHVMRCRECGCLATADWCPVSGAQSEAKEDASGSLRLVETPGKRTVEEVTDFLGITPDRLVKTLLYYADGEPVAALVRGDRDLSEVKLGAALRAQKLEMADEKSVVRLTGADVGFAGPVGLQGVRLIADNDVAAMADFVTGANRTDAHYVNVNLPRDFAVDGWADLKVARADDPCPSCGRPLSVVPAWTLATLSAQAAAPGETFSDDDGRQRSFCIGRCALGISRCMGAISEAHRDDNGLLWPATAAPFEAVIILLNPDDERQTDAALQIYEELLAAGVEVLLDDRDERSGVKFKDADLLGIPVQVVSGRLAAEGKLEVRLRSEADRRQCVLETASLEIATILASMRRTLDESAEEAASRAWKKERLMIGGQLRS